MLKPLSCPSRKKSAAQRGSRGSSGDIHENNMSAACLKMNGQSTTVTELTSDFQRPAETRADICITGQHLIG